MKEKNQDQSSITDIVHIDGDDKSLLQYLTILNIYPFESREMVSLNLSLIFILLILLAESYSGSDLPALSLTLLLKKSGVCLTLSQGRINYKDTEPLMSAFL